MAEEAPRREPMTVRIPDHIGALFETGKNRPSFRDYWTGKDFVPINDILKKKERDVWLLENIRVFSDGTLPSPEEAWKPVMDFWLTELKVAAKNAEEAAKSSEEAVKYAKAGLSEEEIEKFVEKFADLAQKEGREKFRKGIKETESDIKAMFAVSSSARAMEQTAGNAAKYVYFMTGMPWRREREPDLDVQDYWAEFLLHNDAKKLERVLAHDLVRHYYKRLIEEAGIEIEGEPKKPEKEETVEEKRAEWLRTGTWKPNWVEKALTSKLLGHLSKRNPYLETREDSEEVKKLKSKRRKEWKRKISFNEYIADVLLTDKDREKMLTKGWSEENQWAAAKLACDAFLVDKYTKWEYGLDQRVLAIQKERDEKEKGLQLMPFPGWGGNPLRAIIEPSFLPSRIKGMYKKEDKAIMEMTDLAFRPAREFEKISKEFDKKVARGEAKDKDKPKLLPPSMVIHLKAYARYNSALWAFLGSSRGTAIPQWTEDTIYKELPLIAELLDQVYGGIEEPKANTGKHIVGAMMVRILQCKALATAVESARPGFRDNMALLFGAEIARPFLKIEQYIWGPHLDAKRGFLASLAAGRTRFVFKNNQFGAERDLRDAWEILSTNDQDPRGRGKAKMLNTIGFILDAVQAIAAGGKRR